MLDKRLLKDFIRRAFGTGYIVPSDKESMQRVEQALQELRDSMICISDLFVPRRTYRATEVEANFSMTTLSLLHISNTLRKHLRGGDDEMTELEIHIADDDMILPSPTLFDHVASRGGDKVQRVIEALPDAIRDLPTSTLQWLQHEAEGVPDDKNKSRYDHRKRFLVAVGIYETLRSIVRWPGVYLVAAYVSGAEYADVADRYERELQVYNDLEAAFNTALAAAVKDTLKAKGE